MFIEKGQMPKFRIRLNVLVPEDLLYQKSVDEWADWMFYRYDVERVTITSFEAVAEQIIFLWTAGFDEFQNAGIVPDIETLESLG